ncbi:MAG: type II secretion system F family protein [Candidatus Accumulibacter sp.]|jgi:type IV pilus assembly protein PilC|nr:type II secretion system F family protein [Accumulibacter sp.]
MSTWHYLAIGADGREVRGSAEASDEGQARRQVLAQGLRLLEIGGEAAKARGDFLRSLAYAFMLGLSVRTQDMQMFYRQMQLMLRAGHTLIEALEATAHLARRPRMARALERCAERISAGSSFSAALARESAIFPRIAVKLTEAGEASGELDAIFERLALLTERRADVRRQVLTALTYPSIVLFAAIGVISFLVITVIPRFATFLQSRGRSIPWAAKTMMNIADWLSAWGGQLLLTALVSVGALLLARRLVPWARLVSDHVFLRLPLVGGALMAGSMAQISWTFGLLLKSRLTVLDALNSVGQITANAALARAFARASDAVLEGKALAVAFTRRPIPALLRHMAAIGERSGEMETVLEALGTYYQRDLDARVKFLSSMIEPVLTLLIGGVVGFVYYAFFQAVLAVSTGGG